MHRELCLIYYFSHKDSLKHRDHAPGGVLPGRVLTFRGRHRKVFLPGLRQLPGNYQEDELWGHLVKDSGYFLWGRSRVLSWNETGEPQVCHSCEGKSQLVYKVSVKLFIWCIWWSSATFMCLSHWQAVGHRAGSGGIRPGPCPQIPCDAPSPKAGRAQASGRIDLKQMFLGAIVEQPRGKLKVTQLGKVGAYTE